MEICLRKLTIFLIILFVLTISTANASDIDLDNGDLNENCGDLNIENVREANLDLENSELCDLKAETVNLDIDEEIVQSNIDYGGETIISSLDSNENNNIIQDNNEEIAGEGQTIQDNSDEDETEIVKSNPKITIDTSKLKSRDVLVVYLKDKNQTPLKNKNIIVHINNKNYKAKTNSNGMANINIFLLPKSYNITIDFAGDDEFNAISRNTTIKVSKLNTKIKTYKNFVVRKNKLYIYLFGEDEKHVSGRKLVLIFKKRTYTKTTNKYGYVTLKISQKPKRYYIKTKFKGDNYFSSSYKNFYFYVTNSLKFTIGNEKILKNGYLRIYLKANLKKYISNKKMTIKIGFKKFVKRTNSEGIIVIKPNLTVRNHTVVVKYGKYHLSKKLACINNTVKDPFKHNITLRNGVPNIDYMPGNYVMGDESATYTLKRSQYLEVIRRDSYCLFLNNKLSKYVFFKTKNHPNRYHIIKREKWNVIEREINKKLVRANTNDYWPGKITVSLKGKAYKYSEVRDVQNTYYTCGPTAASVCSQVLRNYVCESRLAKLSKTDTMGTKIQNLVKSLKKYNCTCTYFYRDSFSIGLNELKKGGCAVVFHAQNHYVTILDISKDGKKVLVSNSYGSYDGIPTKWLSVSYMNTKFGHFDDSIVIRLNYTLSESKKNSINCFYNSMGTNWYRHGIHSKIGRV